MEQLNTRRGLVTVVADCSVEVMQSLGIDAGLGFFWHNRPDLQREALLKIAAQPHGHVTIAHDGKNIIGYVTITDPDADTRWGRDKIEGLLELGGIEVGREWRGLGVSRAILAATFDGTMFEDAIVLATGYRWCWDVEATGLTVREYRDMLNTLFEHFGFKFYETDEPNIAWYPDNALVVRIGKRASSELVAKFKALLFERSGSEYASSEFATR